MQVGTFKAKASAITILFFYIAVVIIVGSVFCIERSARVEAYISPIDNLAEYINY